MQPRHPKRIWLVLTVIAALLGVAGVTEAGPPDYESERAAMVERLRGSDISDQHVLAAMLRVPRHLFVPSPSPAERARAYQEADVSAGGGQVLYRPTAVALAMQMLAPKPGEEILTVGSGCGYCIAVIAEITPHVYAVDSRRKVIARAEARLGAIGYSSVKWRNAEGCKGWKAHGPFDGILVMCATDAVPEELIRQVREGGRVVIPIGRGPGQTLNRLRKVGGTLRADVMPMPIRVDVMACRPDK